MLEPVCPMVHCSILITSVATLFRHAVRFFARVSMSLIPLCHLCHFSDALTDADDDCLTATCRRGRLRLLGAGEMEDPH